MRGVLGRAGSKIWPRCYCVGGVGMGTGEFTEGDCRPLTEMATFKTFMLKHSFVISCIHATVL